MTLPPSFAEIHAAGQVILESEAAAYHQNDVRQARRRLRAGLRRHDAERVETRGGRNTSSPIALASRSATP